MPAMILGLLFLVFGAVSIRDAQRIASTIRKRGTLDVIGPDGYLEGTAVLLIVVGILLLVQGVIAWRRGRTAVPATPALKSTIGMDDSADAALAHAAGDAAAGASARAAAGASAGAATGAVAGASTETAVATGRHIALLGVLVAYAVALPLAGYAIATSAALTALFRIMGVRGWLKVILWALGTTAVFYVGFVVVADLPLPKGLPGFALNR
jgi:hypothetical protein